MKKIIKKIFIILILFIPFIVNATSIKNIEISGNEEVTFSNDLETKVTINFEDLSTSVDNEFGILEVEYDLFYDEELLKPYEIESTDFITKVYKLNNVVHVLSYVKTLDNGFLNPRNSCYFNELYCSSYNALIKFKSIKYTDKKTNIEVRNVTAKIVDYKEVKETYTNEDIIDLNIKSTSSMIVKINKSNGNVNSDNIKSIIEDKEFKLDNINIVRTNKTESNVVLSSNNNISSLIIKNYKIDFDSNKLEYEINVDEDVNELNIDVKLEDEKASYQIIGDKDLSFYGNKVKIKVTSEDGNVKEYTINVNKDIQEEKIIDEKAIKNKIKETIKVNKKNKTIFLLSGVLIILIVLLIVVVSKMNNKKIDKYLDKL